MEGFGVVGQVQFRPNGTAHMVLKPAAEPAQPRADIAQAPPTPAEVMQMIARGDILLHTSRKDTTKSELRVHISNVQSYRALRLTKCTWSDEAWSRLRQVLLQPKRKRKMLEDNERHVLPLAARLALPPTEQVASPGDDGHETAQGAGHGAGSHDSSSTSSSTSSTSDSSDESEADASEAPANVPGSASNVQAEADVSAFQTNEQDVRILKETITQLEGTNKMLAANIGELEDALVSTEEWIQKQEKRCNELETEVKRLKELLATQHDSASQG